MQTGKNQQNSFIAWNGVSLYCPADWDLRVSGLRHLVFEKDFQPQLQIRWEKASKQTPNHLRERLTGLGGETISIIPENDLPTDWLKLKEKFASVSVYREESGAMGGGICFCRHCNTVVLFQLLSQDRTLPKEAGNCIATLSCHNDHDILWRVQDFSLLTPEAFILQDYTFGAGLTRLSFINRHLYLQTCKLAPADTRLSLQSLAEILLALTGTTTLEIVTDEDNKHCTGYRRPSIARQILLRLRREKPFLLAKAWHDTESNRLLAVVLSSNRPIARTTADKLCKHYEIVQ
jgi:hypothetical protein